MKTARLLNIIPNFPYPRQLPASFEAEQGVRFFFGPGEEPYDYLICYDELKVPLSTRVPKERRLLIIGEPPCITRYPSEYLNLFGTVICPYDLPKFKGRQIRTSPALWWFYGMNPKGFKEAAGRTWTWDELAALPVPEKSGLVSTLCSNKAFCSLHGRRRKFVERLRPRLGDKLAVFGANFLPAPDKKDAIDPYKYHLVIENNDERGFWTEKLADAYLGYAFPFYVGGEGVEADFPPGAMIRLDIRNVDNAAALIEKSIADGVWEARLPAIREARDKVLREYNTFFRIAAALEGMPGPDAVPQLSTPENLPLFWQIRRRYHFREHINHMAIKHLPLRGPIFKL